MPQPCKVLVVDDDHEIRLIISTVMTQAGYQVDAVADGNMALALIATTRPDIVLLDAHLPGIDGWQVCRTIKGSEETRHIPVLMLTAFAGPETYDRTMTSGADELMTKPFRADKLLEAMSRLLDPNDNEQG